MLRPAPPNLPSMAADSNNIKAQLAAEIARIEAELAAKKQEQAEKKKQRRFESLKSRPTPDVASWLLYSLTGEEGFLWFQYIYASFLLLSLIHQHEHRLFLF